VIALPPSLAGAVKVTVACALPAVAVPIVGALGAVAGAIGVTLFDGADGGPVPMPFVAGHGERVSGAVGESRDIDRRTRAVQLPVMDPGDDVAV
jgi:hypothetical protein